MYNSRVECPYLHLNERLCACRYNKIPFPSQWNPMFIRIKVLLMGRRDTTLKYRDGSVKKMAGEVHEAEIQLALIIAECEHWTAFWSKYWFEKTTIISVLPNFTIMTEALTVNDGSWRTIAQYLCENLQYCTTEDAIINQVSTVSVYNSKIMIWFKGRIWRQNIR